MTIIISGTKYHGMINTVHLGVAKMPVGGQRSFYLHDFEGENPYPPRLALEVWDYDPVDDWPKALLDVYQGVRHNAGLWAKRCVEYGADMVTLHLKSTSPSNQDLGADQAIKNVGSVLEEIDVPLIVMGVDHADKDVETLSAVAEEFSGRNLTLGPVTARNYKRLGAQALAHGHCVVALSPTDFNLAKQLNILLYGMGLPKDRILMDPTAAALGYGMEYCYSVMEQLQIAALVVDGQDAQHPMISFFGEDVWKTKEATQKDHVSQATDNQLDRGVMLEATEAISMIVAGAGILSMRHPETLTISRDFLSNFHNSR